MAPPLSASRFLAALRAEGVKVVEVPGWVGNNRNHVGKWGPVYGSMLHHTVTPKSMSAVRMCFDGIQGLPGPLCHGVIRRDGSVHLVGYGRANHAGGGDPAVLAAVRDERYTTRPPAPHQHQGSAGAVDGNPHFYGWECENLGDGKDPWPAVQVDAMVRVQAALIRAHRTQGDDWTEKSVIEHLEWSDWKSDPRGPGYPGGPSMRAKIGERLKHPASWNGRPVPPPPVDPRDDDMPDLLHLSRTEDLLLVKDEPQTVYWTTEHFDEAQSHGHGGKTVLINGRYTGVLTVSATGLNEGEVIDVYPVEENSAGVQIGAGGAVSVPGHGGVGAAPVQAGVGVLGRVGQRLAFEVVSRQETPVTVTRLELKLFTWPND